MNTSASKLLLEQYYTWDTDYVGGSIKFDPKVSSSILYDLVVPMYFLYPEYFTDEYGAVYVNEKGECKKLPSENIRIVTKLINKEEVIKDFIKVIRGIAL